MTTSPSQSTYALNPEAFLNGSHAKRVTPSQNMVIVVISKRLPFSRNQVPIAPTNTLIAIETRFPVINRCLHMLFSY